MHIVCPLAQPVPPELAGVPPLLDAPELEPAGPASLPVLLLFDELLPQATATPRPRYAASPMRIRVLLMGEGLSLRKSRDPNSSFGAGDLAK
jgi:hypothetical protein